MKRHFLPALLVACTLVVALWLVMARKSGQGFKPFDLTARDFTGFEPTLPGWSVRSIPVSTSDPTEPNIAAYVAVSDKRQAVSGKREDGKDSPLGTAAPTLPTNPQSRLPNDTPASQHSDTPTPPHSDTSLPLHASQPRVRVLVRLVHGYNMPMCMKIKGYTVEECGNLKPETRNLSQTRPKDHGIHKNAHSNLTSQGSSSTAVTQSSGFSPQVSSSFSSPSPSSDSDTPPPPYPDTLTALPHQLWRVTSSDGVSAIWVTTMIRAGDFAPTTADICSMAFPRVDVADDPRWIPRGFTWSDLRHPVASLRQWGRARWNASRTDLLTFLRLRQPAWASEELLTYVTSSVEPVERFEMDAGAIDALLEVHSKILGELQGWRSSRNQ